MRCGRRCRAAPAQLALARRGQRDAGAQLDLRPLERHVEAAVQLDRAGELIGGGVRRRPRAARSRAIACASAASASAWPVAGRIRGERLGTGVRARAVARGGEVHGRPAQPPERVVVVVAVLPAGEHRAAALPRLVVGALRGGDARQRRGRVDRHVVVAERATRRRARTSSSRRAGAELALEGVDAPEQALGDVDGGAGGDQLAAHPRRARPVAALAQHVGHARDAGDLGACVRARSGTAPSAVSSASSARAVVGRLVQRDAEALVELGGDRREVVLEREGEAAADRLQAARRSRRASRAPCPRAPARGCAGRCARRASASRSAACARARSPRRGAAARRRWLAIARRSTAASAGCSRAPRRPRRRSAAPRTRARARP